MNKILFFISSLLLSCTPKAVKTEPEVTVKVEAPFSFEGSDKVEALYEFVEADCKIAWQTYATKKDQNLEVCLRNRSECKIPFSQVVTLHEKVITRILKDYPPAVIKSIGTGGLKSIQPDGSWNLSVARAAEQSSDYKDFRKNYPKHKSGKSSNGILTELIIQTQPHAPFKEMLAKSGLYFELGGVEKVFQTKNKQGVTLIDEAGSMWWKPVNN